MGNNWSNNQNYNWPQKGNFWQNNNQNNNQKQQAVEPMEVGPSSQLQNEPNYSRQPNNNWQANNNQGRHNNNCYQNNNRSNVYRTNQNRGQTQAQKREPDGTVNQPANKVTRLNNINEDNFLDQTPTVKDCNKHRSHCLLYKYRNFRK